MLCTAAESRGRSKMIDRHEVLNIVQAWEEAADKDEMAENILYLLGYRHA